MIPELELLPTIYLWLYVALAVGFLTQGILAGTGRYGAAKVASLGRGELLCLRAQNFYDQAADAFREDQFCFLKEPVDL